MEDHAIIPEVPESHHLAHEPDGSTPKPTSILEAGSHQNILESILAQKMSLTASTNFMRSNSVHSVDSVCSAGSLTSEDHCRCDDCFLGITDMLFDGSEVRFFGQVVTAGDRRNSNPGSPRNVLRRKVFKPFGKI